MSTIFLIFTTLFWTSLVFAQPNAKRIIKLVKKSISKSSYHKTCEDLLEFSTENQVRLISLNSDHKNSKYLLGFRCNSGAYNSSYIYFLLDSKTESKNLPPLVAFPNDPQLILNKDHQENWRLERYETQVFTSHWNQETLELFSYRKGLGDGSKGYYTKYKIDANSGLPQLLVSISRIEQDHQAGYHFSTESQPTGKGWLTLEPQQKLTGKLVKFK
ncbi:MAG: hypothetical protein HUU56_17380 [Bdellovibrionaceae bacterium]|nr:hypothetical protein [Pseudobdellovibrionaceae bacterium]